MILNASQLKALRQRNDEELRKEQPSYGYPAQTIRDLLHTIEATKKEKKKWQRLAQERGSVIEILKKTLNEEAS